MKKKRYFNSNACYRNTKSQYSLLAGVTLEFKEILLHFLNHNQEKGCKIPKIVYIRLIVIAIVYPDCNREKHLSLLEADFGPVDCGSVSKTKFWALKSRLKRCFSKDYNFSVNEVSPWFKIQKSFSD